MEKYGIVSFDKVETNKLTTQTIVANKTATQLLKIEILKIKKQIILAEEEFIFIRNKNAISISQQNTQIKTNTFNVKGEIAGVPIGSIIAYAGNQLPKGWLVCNGGKITNEEYPLLFQLIGENVPDLINHFIMGTNEAINNRSEGKSKVDISWKNIPELHLKDLKVSLRGRIHRTNDNGNGVNYIVNNGKHFKSNSLSASIGNSTPQPIEIDPEHIKLCYLIKAK